MADNTAIKDGAGAAKTIATDELSDTSQSPKVTLLDGSGSPTGISPATSGLQTAGNVLLGAVNETAPASDTASSGLNGRLQRIAQRITSLIALVPAALTGSGNFKVAVNEAIVAGNAFIGRVTAPVATTATLSNVSGSASSVTLLASNSARLGGSIVNDSTAILYILLGAGTASTTNYSYVLDGKTTVGGMFEIPPGFTAQITGIWASATGTARVTERTA